MTREQAVFMLYEREAAYLDYRDTLFGLATRCPADRVEYYKGEAKRWDRRARWARRAATRIDWPETYYEIYPLRSDLKR